MLGFGGGLVEHPPGTVRRLTGGELWRLQGGSDAAWSAIAGDNLEEQNVEPHGDAKEALLRGVPVEHGLFAAEFWRAGKDPERAGTGERVPHPRDARPEGSPGMDDLPRVLVAGRARWRGAPPSAPA